MEVKQRIAVSPEMLAFVGPGCVPTGDWPDRPLVLRFAGVEDFPELYSGNDGDDETAALVLVVARAACERIFGPLPEDDGPWHLPSELRALVLAIRDCPTPGAPGETLRGAKSIELLCGVFDHLARASLVPLSGCGTLSETDAARIAAARRLIDERWQEKLTLDSIARACGLNRGKLARGFRSVYDCTVADALTAQRLAGARWMLRATDLPIKAIGYRCGYLNNASFTRAFSRHFGLAPTQFRAMRAAA